MNQIDTYIQNLPAWQQNNLTVFRRLIHDEVPDVVEQFKWSVPVFVVNNKMHFAMSAFKAHTKYNFIFNGADLKDPDQLFNNGLESKRSRSIDLREDQVIDEQQLRQLILESITQ